ncbi:unnamed protein product [Linum tenue]|uniref:Defensin-like protein n=1 Tax=Linum tenue TaxID=586396 RepID=A0AAV0JD60_9ROSI|nr:unnamed protein product [Linum tenue]
MEKSSVKLISMWLVLFIVVAQYGEVTRLGVEADLSCTKDKECFKICKTGCHDIPGFIHCRCVSNICMCMKPDAAGGPVPVNVTAGAI